MQIIEQGKPKNQASKALILLHGRGGNAYDILSLAEHFCDDQFYIAAPQATHNSWYPNSFMADEQSNEPWLASAIDLVKKWIDETAKTIPKEHIFIMGFSQGACLSLEVASRYATTYGGVVAFSGGLIGSTLDEKKYHGHFNGTNVFIGISDQDPHVPLSRAEQSKALMDKLGAKVTLKVYPGMGHIINSDEIDWVKKTIFKQIG